MKKYFNRTSVSFNLSLVFFLSFMFYFVFGTGLNGTYRLHGTVFSLSLYFLSLLSILIAAISRFLRKDWKKGSKNLLLFLASVLMCALIFFVVLLLFVKPDNDTLLSSVSNPEKLDSLNLKVGEILPKDLQTINNTNLYLTHPGQLEPYVRIDVGDIGYLIAYEKGTFRITYIRTDDPRFKTREGFKTGAIVRLSKKDLNIFPGWEIHGPRSQNGWSTIVGNDSKIQISGQGNPIDIKELDNADFFDAVIMGFSKGKF